MSRAPHQHNGRFYNYPGEKKKKVFWRSLNMYISACLWGPDDLRASPDQLPLGAMGALPLADEGRVKTTWIGHSTFLLESPHANILTDPVFGDLTLFFKRLQKPGLQLHELPKIDLVLISHNHRDHMDKAALQTIAQLYPECMFYVPMGDKAWLNHWGIKNAHEFTWWQSATLGAASTALSKVEVTFLPAIHWSQRSLFDYNRSLWGSWMVRLGDTVIYFAGDTAYGEHFTAIQKEFSVIDAALMPIGPCEPRVWMRESHISAEDAGKAFLELGARNFVPMHWGTFGFGVDSPQLPLQRLQAWWASEVGVTDATLHALKIGGSAPIANKSSTAR